MPVQVRIALNEDRLETFHIGRMTKLGMKPDSVNEYAVVNQEPEPTNAQWDAAPRFTHRYGDSLTVLSMEAIACHLEHKKNSE